MFLLSILALEIAAGVLGSVYKNQVCNIYLSLVIYICHNLVILVLLSTIFHYNVILVLLSTIFISKYFIQL